MVKGVMRFFAADSQIAVRPRSLKGFYQDLDITMRSSQHNAVASTCYGRLSLLEEKFRFHQLFNKDSELLECKVTPKCDFYNTIKVDNNCHASSSMSQDMLI